MLNRFQGYTQAPDQALWTHVGTGWFSVGLFCSGLMCMFFSSPSWGVQAIPVNAEPITAEVYRPTMSAIGRLHKSSEQSLSFKTRGYVAEPVVAAGSRVKAGQYLVGLRLNEIQAQADKASSLLSQAQVDYERAKRLRKQGVATKEQVDNAKTQLEVAESERQVAEYNLRYSTLTAPSDGIVLRTLVETNQWVQPGQGVVIFAPDSAAWVFRFGLSDRGVATASLGQQVTVRFSAWPETPLAADMVEIAGAPDPETGLFMAEAQLHDRGVKWHSGFTGVVTLIGEADKRWVSVPLAAIVDVDYPFGDLYRVQDKQIERLRVRLGPIMAGRVWAMASTSTLAADPVKPLTDQVKPLAAGQHILVSGARFVKPGAKLNIHFTSQQAPLTLIVSEERL